MVNHKFKKINKQYKNIIISIIIYKCQIKDIKKDVEKVVLDVG